MQNFILTILGSIIGSAFGSYFSFYIFKKKKAWEEQKIIYEKIVSALRDIEVWAEYDRASHYGEPTNNYDVKSLDESLSVIGKYSEIENSFLSDDFIRTLKKALIDINSERYHEHENSLGLDTDYDRSDSYCNLAIKIRDIASEARNSLVTKYKNDSKLCNIAFRKFKLNLLNKNMTI